MTNHLRLHSGEKPYRCSVCGMRFSHPDAMTNHLQAHARHDRNLGGGAKATQSSTKGTQSLRAAQSPAKGNQSLRAAQSPRTAQSPRAAQPLRAGHPANKLRHHCKICGKWFTRKAYLNYHLQMHTSRELGQPRVWPCRNCAEQFPSKSAWRMHQRLEHSDRALLECNVCSKKFVFLSELARHQSQHTGGVWACDVCRQRFTRRDHLAAHRKRHHPAEAEQAQGEQGAQGQLGDGGIACEICQKKFKHMAALNGHKRIHAVRPVVLRSELAS